MLIVEFDGSALKSYYWIILADSKGFLKLCTRPVRPTAPARQSHSSLSHQQWQSASIWWPVLQTLVSMLTSRPNIQIKKMQVRLKWKTSCMGSKEILRPLSTPREPYGWPQKGELAHWLASIADTFLMYQTINYWYLRSSIIMVKLIVQVCIT